MKADKVLTCLSIRCQGRFACQNVGMPNFVENHQVYSAQAVAIALIELTRSIEPP